MRIYLNLTTLLEQEQQHIRLTQFILEINLNQNKKKC
jgi:hypothetical protein